MKYFYQSSACPGLLPLLINDRALLNSLHAAKDI